MMSSRFRSILAAVLVALVSLVAVTGSVSARRGELQRGDAQRGNQRGMGGVGITIFAEANFGGLNANFRNDVSDLRKYGMNDRVYSLLIGRGEVWEVCQDINYKGRCQVFSGDESNLGRVGWGGLISSFRRLRDNDDRARGRGDVPFFQMRSRLVLFNDVGFRGGSFVVDNTTPMLRALGNRARSVKAYGGAWELCDGDQFKGRCVVITGSEPDLGRVGLRDKVSSVRPVGGQGRGRGR